MRFRSLAGRLAAFMLIAQVLGFVVTGFGIELLTVLKVLPGNQFWNDFAEPRTRLLVVESLARNADGSLRLEPTPALRSYVERTPTFRFAVFQQDSMKALPGSSPDLAPLLAADYPVRIDSMGFQLHGERDPNVGGGFYSEDTPYGRLKVATFGYVSRWDDLIYSFFAWGNMLKLYLPEFLIAIAMGWVALKRGLEPLAEASQRAEQIDFDALDQRLPTTNMPTEIKPLVASFNGALERADGRIARERRFIANAAHELRTPIAILRARLEELPLNGVQAELQSDVRHIQNIVDQLLANARASEKAGSLDSEIDLVETIRAVATDYAPLVLKANRHIEFDARCDSLMVRGSLQSLASIAGNLIDNALRAEPEGGIVLVRIESDATLSVIDHGAGVDPADRERIFETFWRKDEASPGSGLGLAITKELIEKVGGNIWVEETPGGGATFKCQFDSLECATTPPS